MPSPVVAKRQVPSPATAAQRRFCGYRLATIRLERNFQLSGAAGRRRRVLLAHPDVGVWAYVIIFTMTLAGP